MTDPRNPEISADELEWSEAVVAEGRQPGTVVSVRLDPDEAARLRQLADTLGLNVSQVMRRALAAFSPSDDAQRRHLFLGAFTYGGIAPMVHERIFYNWLRVEQLPMPSERREGSDDVSPTATEPSRVTERVLVG